MEKGYKTEKLSFNRKVVRASVSVTGKGNTIHSFSEVDITEPRKLIKEYFEKTGEKLSFTAYIVSCLVQVVKQYPYSNSFIRRNKIILLDDITISVLIERELHGEKVPEPFVINKAQLKTYKQIHNEIREAQNISSDKMGSLSNSKWLNLIPGFLLKAFIKLSDKSIVMAKKYGKVAVTAVGMFSKEPVWFIPHGSGTVLITIGSISKKVVAYNNEIVSREHLCITASFNHNIIDGAPAARFMNQFIETIKSGSLLHDF